MRFGFLLPCGLLPLIAGAAPALAEGLGVDPDAAETNTAVDTGPVPEPDWAGTVELYGFAPLRTTTKTTIQGITTEVDADLGKALRALTAVFSIRGSVEYKRIGFLTDLSYLSVQGLKGRTGSGNRVIRPDLPFPTTASVTVDNDQGIYDFALTYRFGPREKAIGAAGAVTVIPYAGIRIVDEGLAVSTTLSQGPFELRSNSRSFGSPIVQPLLGIKGQVLVAPRLRLFARGDLGGFGANGHQDLSANAQLGLGYAIGHSTQLDLSWRYLHLARDTGDSPPNAYNVNQNGIEMGVKFFF